MCCVCVLCLRAGVLVMESRESGEEAREIPDVTSAIVEINKRTIVLAVACSFLSDERIVLFFLRSFYFISLILLLGPYFLPFCLYRPTLHLLQPDIFGTSRTVKMLAPNLARQSKCIGTSTAVEHAPSVAIRQTSYQSFNRQIPFSFPTFFIDKVRLFLSAFSLFVVVEVDVV